MTDRDDRDDHENLWAEFHATDPAEGSTMDPATHPTLDEAIEYLRIRQPFEPDYIATLSNDEKRGAAWQVARHQLKYEEYDADDLKVLGMTEAEWLRECRQRRIRALREELWKAEQEAERAGDDPV